MYKFIRVNSHPLLPGFLNYFSDFLGARDPIRNATGAHLVIFAVAGEEGNFRSSLCKTTLITQTS